MQVQHTKLQLIVIQSSKINDRAPIKYENNQIIVTGSSTNMYIQFITPVTGVWIGHYSNRTSYRYCDYTYNQTCNRCR